MESIDPEALLPGSPVKFAGEVVKAFPSKKGEGAYGPWEVRTLKIQQQNGREVEVSAWNHSLLMKVAVGAHLSFGPNQDGKGCTIENNTFGDRNYNRVKISTTAAVVQEGQGSDPFGDQAAQQQATASGGSSTAAPRAQSNGSREDPVQRSIQLSVCLEAYSKLQDGLTTPQEVATWVHGVHRAVYLAPSTPLSERIKDVYRSLLDWLGISDAGPELAWKAGFESDVDPSDVLERNLISATGKGNTQWVTNEETFKRFQKDISGLVASAESAPQPATEGSEEAPF